MIPVFVILLAAAACPASPAAAADATSVRTFHAARPGSLEAARRRVAAGDRDMRAAVERLVTEADDLVGVPPPSVVHKTHPAPSGDPHDYASLAPYYWPDPDAADGLPYVRRDGRRNPECGDQSRSDRERMWLLGHGIETLALAWHFTRDESYARHAAALARTWFIADDTRMNPHLRFAQAVRGANEGRSAGILEGRHLAQAVDALALVADASVLTADERLHIDAWGREYLDWLLDSRPGRDERDAGNNHGTYYDLQVALMALAVGREDLAREVLEQVGPRRIATQIESDGSQPRELARTRSLGYSLFNLGGLCRLATLGDHVGVDLWHFTTDDGRSIRRAIDFLAPYVGHAPRPWPHEQITPVSPDDAAAILRRAAVVYGDPLLVALVAGFPVEPDRIRLFFAADPAADRTTPRD